MLFRNDSLNIHFQIYVKEKMQVEAFSNLTAGLLSKTGISVINPLIWGTSSIFLKQRCNVPKTDLFLVTIFARIQNSKRGNQFESYTKLLQNHKGHLTR